MSNVFQMGGAQAIAAFAFGTRTVPKADRIVGPGNIYVAAAKKLLAGEVGIDFVRRAVLLVVGVQDEQHLERLHEHRIRFVLRLRHPRDHREEILDVAQVVVGIDEGQTLDVAIAERGERRQLGEQAHDRDVALLGIVDVLRFGIERRQRRDRRAEHRHRMRVVAEALQERLDVLVHVRVVRDVVHPLSYSVCVGSSPWRSSHATSRNVAFSASCSIG